MANKWRFSPALALLTSCFLLASALAAADPDLDQKMRNPDNWAAQAGDAANHRWSNLKQIDLGGSLFVFALPDSLTHTAMHGESQGDWASSEAMTPGVAPALQASLQMKLAVKSASDTVGGMVASRDYCSR